MTGWVSGTPVQEALDGAMTAIAAAGCETPRLDAEVLLAHVLGVARERLLLDDDLTVTGPAVRAFPERGAPPRGGARAGRIHHRAPWLSPPGADRAIAARWCRARRRSCSSRSGLALPRGARVLDVGTGSGAVALALKDERPDLHVTGSDISEAALELARANGERLGLEVRWLRADLLAGVEDEFDAVLANPPYVAESERASLAPEILRHEPHEALFAGEDGLDCDPRAARPAAEARSRASSWPWRSAPGRLAPVAGLTRAAGFQAVRIERDLAGIERLVVGERR